jgi:GNAT superfamily N-acetyltransferase
MLTILRTDSENADFKALVKLLDESLKITDGEDHAFYNQFNKINQIKYVVVAYEGDVAVGCGAIKYFHKQTVEVKRMFVQAEQRGKGVASEILDELEAWAIGLGYTRTILETGLRQIEALHLYAKQGYEQVPNYGQYADMDNSRCFEKVLI